MTMPRKNQISLADTKYYHCISRCVRRAFLCGKDLYSGKSFEHRRKWVENKIFFLTTVFCIDICAYAVMSNHLHLVLHVNDKQANNMSDEEVLIRWHKLFKGSILTQKFLSCVPLNEAEQLTLKQTVRIYRERLFSISWFMRILSEDIARRANKEDKCTGRFWEGRFKSQALLDEAALAACMAYVDLNPVRAKIAKTPEKSEYTSIQKRISVVKKGGKQPKTLFPFAGNPRNNMPLGLPFDLKNYIQLVELTGQCIRNDKKAHIKETLPILERLNIEHENWLKLTTEFTRIFYGAVGREKMIDNFCEHLNRKRRVNLSQSRRYLS